MTRGELFGYQIQDELGAGAGSRIYEVLHPKTRQRFAMKHVIRTDDRSVRFIEQLENEYEVGQQVRHPQIRRVIDRHVSRNFMRRIIEAAVVMELFNGKPLGDQQLTVAQILDVFVQTAGALQALHAAGLVHCDLKPGNILVDDAGTVKVIDLGQTCPVGTVKPRIQGTPDYIAPEQVKCQPVSVQTDVYNYGATLYWALTGQKMPTLYTLAKGENSFLVDSQLRTPAELNPLVPPPVSHFVMECVKTTPAKRPADMGVVLSRLTILRHTAADAKSSRTSVA